VILISIDTLRADHLGAYGYSRIKTPHLDALAKGGTLFTAIDAQIPLTLPSHTSLLTSTYPFANHIEENGAIVGPGRLRWNRFCGRGAIERRHSSAVSCWIGVMA